jgi:broad specificity phosphatase PhoE
LVRREVVIAEALRERCSGHGEGPATGSYPRVWAAGETGPGHADGNVEPAAAVLDRATAFIAELERRYSAAVDYLRYADPGIMQAAGPALQSSQARENGAVLWR